MPDIVRWCFIISMVFASYFLMSNITGIKITELILQFISWAFGFLKGVSKKQTIESSKQFARMSSAQRKRSPRHQYYAFVNELLAALHLKTIGITVEGLTIVALLLTLLFTLVTQIVMRGIVMFVLVYAVIYITILAMLYLASRVGALERKKNILNSIDILCSVMQDGIVIAVEGSIHLLPAAMKPTFTKFLRNINNLNISVEESLIILNNDVGPLFDEFCETAISFERERAPGMEQLFSFIVVDNAKEALRDVKLGRASAAANRDFFASCGLMIVMLVYTIMSYDYVAKMYVTQVGNFILMAYALAMLGTFISTQYVLAKSFVYKETS